MKPTNVRWKAGHDKSDAMMGKAVVIFLKKLKELTEERTCSREPIFTLFVSLSGGTADVDKISLELEVNTDKEGKLSNVNIGELRGSYTELFAYRYKGQTYSYESTLRTRTVDYVVRCKCEDDNYGNYDNSPDKITESVKDTLISAIEEAFDTSLFN